MSLAVSLLAFEVRLLLQQLDLDPEVHVAVAEFDPHVHWYLSLNAFLVDGPVAGYSIVAVRTSTPDRFARHKSSGQDGSLDGDRCFDVRSGLVRFDWTLGFLFDGRRI